jgi:hypothetical protein
MALSTGASSYFPVCLPTVPLLQALSVAPGGFRTGARQNRMLQFRKTQRRFYHTPLATARDRDRYASVHATAWSAPGLVVPPWL